MGTARFNRLNSRTREMRRRNERIALQDPQIAPRDVFNRVRRRHRHRHSRGKLDASTLTTLSDRLLTPERAQAIFAAASGPVRSSIREWRTREDSNL